MKFYKILSSSIIFLTVSFAHTSLQAMSLNGLMTINGGVTEMVPAINPVTGEPFIDPATGEVILVPERSGSFFIMGGNTYAALQPGSAGGILLGQYQNFVLNPDEPHPAGHPDATFGAGSGYPADGLVVEGSILQSFSFFGVPTYVGTNPVGYQSGDSHPAPTANVDMSSCVGDVCTLTADLSAWEVFWNGSAFEQGPRPVNTGPFVLAEGIYNLVTREYVLDWDSQIKGGPFGGVPAAWHLEGTVVPVPAAVWLFGSGLMAVFGFARRRKA